MIRLSVALYGTGNGAVKVQIRMSLSGPDANAYDQKAAAILAPSSRRSDSCPASALTEQIEGFV